MKPVVFLYKMDRHDEHTDHRSSCSRSGGSCHFHAKRIDKNIVQYNVGKTSDKHSRHRKSGSSVVSHKTKKKIVSEKERGEEKQYADVVGGVTDRVVIGAGMAEISSEQNAPAKEKKSAQRAAKSRACVKAVRCVSLSGRVDESE